MGKQALLLLFRSETVYWTMANISLAFILLVVLGINQMHKFETDDFTQQLRDLRVEQSLLRRAKTLIQGKQLILENEKASAVSIDDLALSVYEKIKDLAPESNVKVESFGQEIKRLNDAVMKPLNFPFELSLEAMPSAHILRINLTAIAQDSAALLGALGEFVSVAAWRPTELRYCLIERVHHSTSIRATCIVDFYHWKLPL